MGTITESEFPQNVLSILKNEMIASEGEKHKIDTEAKLSTFPAFKLNKDLTSDQVLYDAVVYREVGWSLPESSQTDELDQINELERWFPPDKKTVKVPISVLEFTKEAPMSTQYAVYRSNLEELAQFEPILPIVIKYASLGSSSSSFSKENGVVNVKLKTLNKSVVKNNVAGPLQTHVGKYNNSNLIDSFNLNDMFGIEDTALIYHLNDVLLAYNRGRDNLLVILLSVYFESHIRDILETELKDINRNEDASSIYENSWGFKKCLDSCRSLKLVSDDEFRIIDKIRKARNDYAHSIESFDTTYSTDAEDENIIEEGIRLYENFIGVEKSML